MGKNQIITETCMPFLEEKNEVPSIETIKKDIDFIGKINENK